MGWGACQQHLARSWNLLAGKNKRALLQASKSLSLLGVFWYKALHIISGVWVGTAGRRYCPNLLSLFEEISLERSRLWNCQPEPEWRESHSVSPRGAKMNTVPCRWETQGPLYVHRCKIKDQVLCFSHGDGFPTAKLHYRLTKYRSNYSFFVQSLPWSDMTISLSFGEIGYCWSCSSTAFTITTATFARNCCRFHIYCFYISTKLWLSKGLNLVLWTMEQKCRDECQSEKGFYVTGMALSIS